MAALGANDQTLGAGNCQVQEQSEHQETVEPTITYQDPAKEIVLDKTNGNDENSCDLQTDGNNGKGTVTKRHSQERIPKGIKLTASSGLRLRSSPQQAICSDLNQKQSEGVVCLG